MNRIFSVALVYCDKMSRIPPLGAKEKIKRQRIKFSDSELDLAHIETNEPPYSLWHFPLQFCLTMTAQKQKFGGSEPPPQNFFKLCKKLHLIMLITIR